MDRLFQRDRLVAAGILAASAHHEVKSVLFAAKGALASHLLNTADGVYKEGEILVHAHKAIHAAARQITRAMEILRRLTEFARPRGEKTDGERVSPAEVFQEVLDLARFELDFDRIHSSLEIEEGLAVWGDRVELEEIFLNLILNACQCMKKEGGRLRIEVVKDAPSWVETRIKDTGPGIPQEIRHRIFQPFATTRRQGTGLGLYSTKRLVERNGGKIWFETSPQGTCFVVRLRSIGPGDDVYPGSRG
jgi:signal transduction histidine kinase